MAVWFAKLMRRGHARGRPVFGWTGVSNAANAGTNLDARDPRYDAIVQMLRDREVQDRTAREKRQRFWYRQSLESDSDAGSSASSPSSPIRLYKVRTKVPCRTTAEARALLDALRKQFPGGTVNFAELTNRKQAVMLAGAAGTAPKQIGWMEHCTQTDPMPCSVRDHGLAVETDGAAMLVLRFRHPPTPARASSSCGAFDEAACVNFTEIRTALDLRPSDKGSTPRFVWITRPEVELMNAFGSRDYESFYVRFKREVLAGIWSSLSCLLASLPASQWHQGTHYDVVREPDASTGRILQRTIDDCGRAGDIGSDRVYDAFPATDILLLYLDGDILADIADIYFTLQSLNATDAYFLKEEFFTVIRRFWATSQSLASRYGGDLAAVLRMAQRAVPRPPQVPLLKQDWTNLRQSLIDRYGTGGRKAADLVAKDVHRLRTAPLEWPFASVPAGEINIGLRLVYRRENHPAGAELPTRPIEIENVVLVAEKLPAPGDINLSWVRRHDWILAKALLDESFRDALDTIDQDPAEEQLELFPRDLELSAKRIRLYKHVRGNILHYQRAIWQQEDPQQRSMRYRKSGKKVPLEWQFELESGAALTIDELCDRVAATDVDGHFAAYSAGQEADLDQVIDPERPIGYHGNYAIYHMRPEFGSGDLFSMLHFFKFPYLRANPETEEPAVGELGPQLQLAVSAQTTVSPGTDPSAVGVIRAESSPGKALMLTANGHRDAAAEWGGEVLERDGEQMLLVGRRVVPGHDSESERVILPRAGAGRISRVRAGSGAARVHERFIGVRDDQRLRPSPTAG